MLARPDVTCCCAQENSRNGTTQNDTANTVMCTQSMSLRGNRSCRSATNSPRVRAPRTRRDHATCAGDRPPSATFMNRKLDPQMIPVSTNCTAITPFVGARPLSVCSATVRGGVSAAGDSVGTRRL